MTQNFILVEDFHFFFSLFECIQIAMYPYPYPYIKTHPKLYSQPRVWVLAGTGTDGLIFIHMLLVSNTKSLYCTISIDSSVTHHRALWSGPNFGLCHMSH